MSRSILRPSFTFPVSQHPTAKLSAEQLYPIVWEAIEALELNGLEVVSLTSDGYSANRKFYRLYAQEGLGSDTPYKVRNPHRSSAYIYLFSDVPHLLKTARNCFSNSGSHTRSRNFVVSSILQYKYCSIHLCSDVVYCLVHVFYRKMARKSAGSTLKVYTLPNLPLQTLA